MANGDQWVGNYHWQHCGLVWCLSTRGLWEFRWPWGPWEKMLACLGADGETCTSNSIRSGSLECGKLPFFDIVISLGHNPYLKYICFLILIFMTAMTRRFDVMIFKTVYCTIIEIECSFLFKRRGICQDYLKNSPSLLSNCSDFFFRDSSSRFLWFCYWFPK